MSRREGGVSGARTPLGRAEAGRPARTLAEIMASYERIVLIQALQLNGGSRRKTAESLGITRLQFYRRCRILRINLKEIPTEVGSREGRRP